MNPNNYVIIMAGGVGSRFWPISRKSYPKQFHDIMGVGKTMLTQCADRFKTICPTSNILVVTNAAYKDLVLQSMPYLNPEQILLEPEPKNTAPCIAYAVYKVLKLNPNATFLVTPSDQYIQKEADFVKTVTKALNYAGSNPDFVTVGIVPTRPDTGYGYIQYQKETSGEIKTVLRFAEKPNEQTALQFLAGGDFVWNSGMFIFNSNTITKAFQSYLPEVMQLFEPLNYGAPNEQQLVNQAYHQSPSISFDYAIMEKVSNVKVILGYFGWSDVGTWKSLYDLSDKNEDKNVLDGNVVAYNATQNLVKVPKSTMVVLNGVDNLIVAEYDGVLLISNKNEEQKVKQIVEDLKLKHGNTYI